MKKSSRSKRSHRTRIENKVEFVAHRDEPVENEVPPVKNKVQRVKNKLEPLENKLQPVKNKLKPVENKVAPAENRFQPVEHKVEPVEHYHKVGMTYEYSDHSFFSNSVFSYLGKNFAAKVCVDCVITN